MKIRLLLYTVPLIFSGCAGSSEKFTAWQDVQTQQIYSDKQIKLGTNAVEIVEIRERNKTARAYSNQRKGFYECKKDEHNSQGTLNRKIPDRSYNFNTKGKGKRPPSVRLNDDSDMVLEGVDIITEQLSELIERSQVPEQDRINVDPLPSPYGNPITINANGSTGAITINIGSPGAVATSNASKKKKGTPAPIVTNIPPKSDLQSFWNGVFGLSNNVVTAVLNKADVLTLGAIGLRQANKHTYYENNNRRREYYDFSDRSDNSIINPEAGVEEE